MGHVNSKNNIDSLIHICTTIIIASFIIFDMDYRVSYILVVMTMLIFALVAVRNNFKVTVKIESFHKQILAFILFAIMSSVWAYSPYLALVKASTIVEILVCMSVLYMYYSRYYSVSDLYTILMISGFIVVIYSFYRYGIANIFYVLSCGDRLESIFSNINNVAMISSVAIISFIYKVLFERLSIINMGICSGLSILGMIIIAATGSRKALVMLVVSVFLLFSIRFKSRHFVFTIIKATVIIFILGFILMQLKDVAIFKGIVNRMESLIAMVTGNGRVDVSAENRAKFISIGMNQFMKHPILGYGMGNSGKVLVNAIGGKETYFHNNYVELLVCGGLVGTIVYYLIWIKPIKEIIKYRKFDTAAILSIIMASILLVMDYGAVTYFEKINYFYIMIMYICAKNLRRKKDESQESV